MCERTGSCLEGELCFTSGR